MMREPLLGRLIATAAMPFLVAGGFLVFLAQEIRESMRVWRVFR